MTDYILAKAFAVSNDDEQAGMISTMARELYVRCKGANGFETQVCYLSKKLNEDGVHFIKLLHEFILLREQEMK